MPNTGWELVVRECDDRLIITLGGKYTLYDRYQSNDSGTEIRIPLDDKLERGSYPNVLTFEGYNGASDPWDVFNPWKFEVDIVKDGQVAKSLTGHGSCQRNRHEQKVWSEQVGIRLPVSQN